MIDRATLEQLGPYVLLKTLVVDGRQVEYMAFDLDARRLVRVFRLAQTQFDEDREAFWAAASALREAAVPPRLLRTHQDPSGDLFFAAEFTTSTTIVDLIQRTRSARVPTGIVAGVMEQALTTIDALGRVTPYDIARREALSVDVTGQVAWTPSLGPRWDEYARGTATGSIRSFVCLMSPEQVRGQVVSQRSHMWTVGVLSAGLMRGRLPFQRESDIATLYAIIQGDTEFLDEEELQGPLLPILRRALALDPTDRFASFAEMRAAIEALGLEGADRESVGGFLRAHLAKEIAADARLADEAELFDLDLQFADTEVDLPAFRRPDVSFASPQPQRATIVGVDARPMLCFSCDGRARWVDLSPVSADEYARFVVETEHEAPPSWAGRTPSAHQGPRPVTMVSLDDARAYARWAGKRVPTDDEWLTAVRAHSDETLSIGAVWEWTSTPVREGHCVRGGPWRDRAGPGDGSHASWETGRAPDLGFRCVDEEDT